MFFCKKKETEVQNISRDQVEVMLELEGQLLHEQVHVLVNLEPVQVVGVALGKINLLWFSVSVNFIDKPMCINKF